MRIGIQITGLSKLGTTAEYGNRLASIARTAEEAGFYSLWFPDHLLNAMMVMGFPLTDPVLEGYSTISFLAALTKRMKIGVQVTCPIFRHPALLVKIISTIDVLSGGRTYLGVGAGWFEREASALGITFPTLHERYERLEEILQIAKHMWSGNVSPYKGKYYQLPEPINSPQPLSHPHPPIMIGGEGERKTLLLVAKYADAYNFSLGPITRESLANAGFDLLQRKLKVLEQHCKDIGRSFDSIEKTAQVWLELTQDTKEIPRVIELCHQLAGFGVDHIIFNGNVHETVPLEIMCRKVMPGINKLL
jgi:F420-dependent oxidoreductase-like protein